MKKKIGKETSVILKNIIVTLLVIAFFISVLIAAYNMLYDEKRNNIINSGEIAASVAADSIDKYLSTNIASVKLSAYTLDEMILNKRSDAEIQDFLVGQSTAIKSAVLENSTGLYGYINGRFFSGTNWEPPEDYDATARPWYSEPLANSGEISLLDPYVDVQSGDVMLAVGKTLCDGVSVISLDISLDKIQEITEEAVSSGESDMEMIINDKAIVVAHSDKGEVGKDYSEEKDTLGAAITEKLGSTDSHSFEIKYQNYHYIVYAASLMDDWYCVSVKDATVVFNSIRVIFYSTVLAVIVVIIVCSGFMISSSRRQLAMERISKQLFATADIYISMHEIDFLTDTFNEVRNIKEEALEMIGETREHSQKMIRAIMTEFSDESSREEALDFVDFSKINERLKNSNTITLEWLNAEKEWRRSRYIVSDRTANGDVARALYLIEDIDDEKRRRDRLTAAAEMLNARISSIANIYMTAHELDIPDDTFFEIKSQLDVVNDMVGESRTNAQATLTMVMESIVDETCIEDIRRFIDLSTLDKRMRDTDTITTEYMNKDKLWRRGRFIVSKRDENGKIVRVIWLSEDIDNEKKERDKLLDMSERAMAASEAKTAFLSSVSHEIRTPINTVLGMNEMILRECDDRNILGYSESIRTAGNTLLSLVNNILDFSRIEAGKMEIILLDYDLSSVINDLVNMIRKQADEKGLELILDISRTVPKLLHGDEVRIKQVITNILTNAVKYTEKGSVTFRLGYEKPADDPDSVMLNVSIEDTGIGIKPEDMKKLFSEFERIEEGRNRKVEGTGLGMSITKRLLGMMGSTLEVESVYGQGSKFSFSLKQAVTRWEELGDYEAAFEAAIDERKKYKARFMAPEAQVLIVDDLPMNLEVFKKLLRQTKVKIDTAESGDEGLALAARRKYDIIFLDHMMPGKDGIATLKELRMRDNDPNKDTPAVCITANVISGAKEEYISAGFDDYITKPIDTDKLESVMLTYLPDEKLITDIEQQDEDDEEISEDDMGMLRALKGGPIDVAAGLKNSGSEASYLALLKIFYEGVDRNVAELERLYNENDLKNYTIKIHGLKSSARIIGASDLGERAQRLEAAGKAEDFEFLSSHHKGFVVEYERYKEVLSGIPLVSPPDTDRPEASHERMDMVFANIREAAEDMDSDRLDDIFDEMDGYSIPEEDKTVYDNVREAYEKYEYKTILSLLKEYGPDS